MKFVKREDDDSIYDWIITENHNQFKPDFYELFLILHHDLMLPKRRGKPSSFNDVDRVGALRFHLLEFLRMNKSESKVAEEAESSSKRHRSSDQPESKEVKINLEKVIDELNDEKKKAIKALWEARDALTKQKSEFSSQIETSKNSLELRDAELSEIINKLKTTQHEASAQSSQMKILQEAKVEIEEKFKRVEVVSMKLKTDNLELQIENNSLKRKLSANDEEIIQIMEQKKKQQQDFDRLLNFYKSLQSESETSKLNFELRINELENRFKSKDQKEKKNEIPSKFELERKLSKLRSEKFLLMREKETAQKAFESVRGEFEAKIRRLELSINVLKAELRTARKRSRLEVDEDSLDIISNMMKKMTI